MNIRTKENFLVFGEPALAEDEINEVLQCLRSGWIGTGPRVAKFEKSFAQYKGVETAVAVNSCTAGLHLALMTLNLSPGDEVITTPFTFCATVNAIIHAGGTPVLADIDPITFNISPNEIAKKITSKTRAILPVHYAGRPCDMSEISILANKNNLVIIEDCAHAIETEYHGIPAGTIGDISCFSFYVTKNIVTAEGGIVLAKNPEILDRIKILALHGMNKDAWKRFGDEGYKHYQVTEVGFKYNMTDMQAALGIRQMEKVDRYWSRRLEIWKRYQQEFSGLPVTQPAPFEQGTKHGLHLYTILIDESRTGISRNRFLDEMTRRHIGVGVHYISLPNHPVYQKQFGWKPEDFPVAQKIGNQTVSLPLSAKLTDDDVNDVVNAVKSILHSSN